MELPKLPEIDQEDIQAVRNFLPGKLLARTAALLSFLVLVLGFAAGVDEGLRHFFDMRIGLSPWQHVGLLIGAPMLIIAVELIMEWRAERARRALQSLAVEPGSVPQGYFRIGPYRDTQEDRAKFTRSDQAQLKVLEWIKRSPSLPLYFTGDSGSGKSSLLNAAVLPALCQEGWTVVESRAWQDPCDALRKSIMQSYGPRRARRAEEDVRDLIEGAARRINVRLLIVLDQFEEFIILGKPEVQERFTALLEQLRAASLPKLQILLTLRSDYQSLLPDLGLPPLRYEENFYQISRFTLAAASKFMAGSDLGLQPDSLRRLINSAAVMDETPGLVRPITLNVLGYVLASGQGSAPSLDAGRLVRFYIEQVLGQPGIRDRAAVVLDLLTTEQGTRQPRSEQDLAAQAGLRRGEVRGVLNALSMAALARPLDDEQGVWELSHDFIARAIARYLGRGQRELLRRSAFFAAPTLLGLAVLAGSGIALWDWSGPLQLRSEISDRGITIASAPGGWMGEGRSNLTNADFVQAGLLLRKLKPFTRLNLANTQVTDLAPLGNLNSLTRLNLFGTQITDVTPLEGLRALAELNMSHTPVGDLRPLSRLASLRQLNLSYSHVTDLTPLANLTKLMQLDLSGTTIADLTPLKGLLELTKLELFGARLVDFRSLQNLTALTQLDLFGTKIADLTPLADLTALTKLNLGGTHVVDLTPLQHLTRLSELDLSYTRIVDLSPLQALTSLTTLILVRTAVPNPSWLKGRPAIHVVR